MNRLFVSWLKIDLLTGLLLSLVGAVRAAEPASAAPPRPFGLEHRTPWTSSRVTGSPEPPSPFLAERIFPRLKFNEPVELRAAPGSDRLFVLELKGKVFSFPNQPDVGPADSFFELGKVVTGVNMVYGMTFHPGFATNRYFYLCYAMKDGLSDGSRVSRFTVTRTDPPQVEPDSEQIIIAWPSGGHNGGCLCFGPDGCLYISTGDGAGPNPPDPLNTGQDISDLLSSVLRIDVDHPEPGKNYRVPVDNPFVKTPGARPEIWAYGFRNPWKMSFDRQAGDLWVGDVGWELWEMVYRVERAGNYGWSIVEGRQPIKPDGRRGPTPILPPVVAHPHSEAASITGGFVYRGARLRELAGAYIYGDWATGKIWALRQDGNKVTSPRELVTTPLQVICFGEDRSGELLIAGYDGTLHRLVPNPARNQTTSFPRRLSETGIFSSAARHEPAPGVLAYSLNAEPWADHAVAERWVALPDASRIMKTNDGKLVFPKDAVLVKTLSVERERGKPASRRRVETQLLHFDGLNWNTYAYQWNDHQTDAALVGPAGADVPLSVKDARAPGGRRQQNWHIASRAECLRCHNSWVGFAAGFEPLQLNRDHAFPAATDNQLRTLAHLGVLDAKLAAETTAKLVNPYDVSANLNERARSWLHVNCAHCHRMHAGGAVLSEMNIEQKLEGARLLGARPSQGGFGMPDAEVIAPGDPLRSVLYYRISTTGQGHMPHLGTTLVDEVGTGLVYDWIKGLPRSGVAEAAAAKQRGEIEGALEQLRHRTPRETRMAAVDRLLASTGGALALQKEFAGGGLAADAKAEVLSKAAGHATFEARDLFERFLPDEQRVKKLGTVIKPEQILALKGDSARGRKLFFQEGGAACQQCHRVQSQGRDFGPDLSLIGRKYGRAQILDNILFPSKSIDAQFISYQLETKDDLSYTGFLVTRTDREVVLKDANLQSVRVAADRVRTLDASKVSVMPEQLLQSMTAQDAADLVEFLGSLR